MEHPLIGKAPDLKFKYVNGMGDFVACILHSKPVGWLTYLITGSKTPCTTCSMRRNALNILIKFPLWKLFFKDESSLLEHLAAEYRSNGYKVTLDTKTNRLQVSKAVTVEHKN
jgi:hypothetical protein